MQADSPELEGALDRLLELVVVSQLESRLYACTDEGIPKSAEIDCGKLATVPPGNPTDPSRRRMAKFD
jgi:hypothetical protein